MVESRWQQEFSSAIEILKVLQTKYPNAIIAGGATRDVKKGQHISDYDVYITTDDSIEDFKRELTQLYIDPAHRSIMQPHATSDEPGNNSQFAKAHGLHEPDTELYIYDITTAYRSTDDNGQLVSDTFHPIQYVLETVEMGSLKFQFIILSYIKPQQYVMDFFDFGICKCFHDGSTAYYSNEFLNDDRNRTVTFQPKYSVDRNLSTMFKHYNKIDQKYSHLNMELKIDQGVTTAC